MERIVHGRMLGTDGMHRVHPPSLPAGFPTRVAPPSRSTTRFIKHGIVKKRVDAR